MGTTMDVFGLSDPFSNDDMRNANPNLRHIQWAPAWSMEWQTMDDGSAGELSWAEEGQVFIAQLAEWVTARTDNDMLFVVADPKGRLEGYSRDGPAPPPPQEDDRDLLSYYLAVEDGDPSGDAWCFE